MERLIEHTTKPGDPVVDPFVGSGVAGEAALRHGRRYIGTEIADAHSAGAHLRLTGHSQAMPR